MIIQTRSAILYVITCSVLITMCYSMSSCTTDYLPSQIKEWIQDSDVKEIVLENGTDTKTIEVTYSREIGDTASPFTKKESAYTIYKEINQESELEIFFHVHGSISFNLKVYEPYAQSLLESTCVIDTNGGQDTVIEGTDNLSIADNHRIGHATYERVAILSCSDQQSFFKELYYSKKNGLVAIADRSNNLWIRK